MKFKDITGRKFGRLSVISFIERKTNGHTYWECLCECGNKIIATNNNLSRNHTKSCGCLQKELVRKRRTTHNFSKTRFYITFHCIKERCNNPKVDSYQYYGGRGIKCLWTSFEDFKDDMYESYLKHIEEFGERDTTIDRVDFDKHYSVKNCRWATQKQQARNRRNNHFITFRGETLCMAEWAERYGIPQSLFKQRISRDRWSIERALGA